MNSQGKKRSSKKIVLTVFLLILSVILISGTITGLLNFVTIKGAYDLIDSVPPVNNPGAVQPEQDDDGNWFFTTDKELKIIQITDIHIGGGCISAKKDAMAINAIASMVTEEKPDLIVITGDMVFPIPVLAGTMNNLRSVKIAAALFEQLSVPWIPVFGNHDSEIYNYYSREDVSDYLESDELSCCIFKKGSPELEGFGNSSINIKNSDGLITHTLFLMDSHEYTDEDPMGIKWKYDSIYQNQIDWYEDTVNNINQANGGSRPVSSLLFFHIPTKEFRDAWQDHEQGGKETKLYYGTVGEKGGAISHPEKDDMLFETMQTLEGKKGIFCGHDHLNNLSMDYKGIRLTYGLSIDYLAYKNISKLGSQRGCTVITLTPDGNFSVEGENYYQDKYKSVTDSIKESVTMQDMAANRMR